MPPSPARKSTLLSELADFLKRLGAVISGLGVVFGLIWFLVSPRFDAYLDAYLAPVIEKADANSGAIEQLTNQIQIAAKTQSNTAQALAQIAETQNKLAENMSGAMDRLAALEVRRKADAAPVIEFLQQGSSISNGAPGDTVVVRWSFLKLRSDCGRPHVDVFFRNGGGRVHRVREISAVDRSGRGTGAAPARPTIPQSITYTMVIPSDQGVSPGQAFGWNQISFPNCPDVPEAISPEVPFQILSRKPKEQ